MVKPILVNRKFQGKYYISGVVVEFTEDLEKDNVIYADFPEQLVSYEEIINFINRFDLAHAQGVYPEKEQEKEKKLKEETPKETNTPEPEKSQPEMQEDTEQVDTQPDMQLEDKEDKTTTKSTQRKRKK